MKLPAALVFAGAALSAGASVTNVVNIAALAAAADRSGVVATNGWTLSGLDRYDEGCVKFDTKGDWLLSPDFGGPMLRIEASVRCSNLEPTRLLYVFAGDETKPRASFAVCAKANAEEMQTISFGADSDVTRIRLQLDGSHNAGVWGIGSLTIVTSTAVSRPEGLRVTRATSANCSVAWENCAGTVSNRVETWCVTRDAAGETVLLETDFDGFEGNPASNRDMTDRLHDLIGANVSGVNVYALAATNGICHLGKTREPGMIRICCCGRYAGVRLAMSAKRYPGDKEQTTVAYELDGGTNAVETIELADEFSEHVVDLSSVPDGAAVLIGYCTTVSNRRVLIDGLSVVRAGAESAVLLDSRWMASASGPAAFSTRGLVDLPARSYVRFAVSSANADGLMSPCAEAEARVGTGGGFGMVLK